MRRPDAAKPAPNTERVSYQNHRFSGRNTQITPTKQGTASALQLFEAEKRKNHANQSLSELLDVVFLVREMRLELTRRLPHAPQTCLSTYSSTLAYYGTSSVPDYYIIFFRFVNRNFSKVQVLRRPSINADTPAIGWVRANKEFEDYRERIASTSSDIRAVEKLLKVTLEKIEQLNSRIGQIPAWEVRMEENEAGGQTVIIDRSDGGHKNALNQYIQQETKNT